MLNSILAPFGYQHKVANVCLLEARVGSDVLPKMRSVLIKQTHSIRNRPFHHVSFRLVKIDVSREISVNTETFDP